jgi:hypothetical protein
MSIQKHVIVTIGQQLGLIRAGLGSNRLFYGLLALWVLAEPKTLDF